MESNFGWRNALFRSFGVMERPMTNMRIAYAFCITDNDPTTFEHHEAFQTAKHAASIVQSGVKNVNIDNLFSRLRLLLLLLLCDGCRCPSLSSRLLALALADKDKADDDDDKADDDIVLVLPRSIQFLRFNTTYFLEASPRRLHVQADRSNDKDGAEDNDTDGID